MWHAVLHQLLDGVADGVAEIQRLAQAMFPFVAGDDPGLDRDTACDDPLPIRLVSAGRDACRDVRRDVDRCHELEVRCITDHAMFQRFGQAVDPLDHRQCLERVEVGHDRQRRVKGADQILPDGGVDAGLATDGRVDHRQQGRRDLDHRHTAQKGRGDKAGEVADNAPPERDHDTVATEPRLEQNIRDRGPGHTRLVFFTGRNRDQRAAILAEGRPVRAIEAAFPGTLKNGAVDRAALRNAVLGKRDALTRLEHILHPMVEDEERACVKRARRRGCRAVVLDIPLLFEVKGDERVDSVVVVSAPKAVQIHRVGLRRRMSKADIEAVIARQMPDSEKRRRADIVIRTGLSRFHTNRMLRRLILDLRA